MAAGPIFMDATVPNNLTAPAGLSCASHDKVHLEYLQWKPYGAVAMGGLFFIGQKDEPPCFIYFCTAPLKPETARRSRA